MTFKVRGLTEKSGAGETELPKFQAKKRDFAKTGGPRRPPPPPPPPALTLLLDQQFLEPLINKTPFRLQLQWLDFAF